MSGVDAKRSSRLRLPVPPEVTLLVERVLSDRLCTSEKMPFLAHLARLVRCRGPLVYTEVVVAQIVEAARRDTVAWAARMMFELAAQHPADAAVLRRVGTTLVLVEQGVREAARE